MHRIREELVEARAEADRLAHIDHLTGVANRRSLAPVLDSQAGRSVGLLLLDLDHFKLINDEHGHAAGDAVLVAVADRLRRSVRADDAVVRMGGEEFLVVLRDIAGEALLRRIGETLRERVGSEPIHAGALELRITVSIGGASVAPGDTDYEAGVRRADRALYAAKLDGRDCVRLDLAA
jgi:diguanylate cyclase (GGDEF)-like protein